MMAKCDLNSMKKTMHEYGEYSTVNYYPSSARFSVYDGIDMIPENKHTYVRGTPWTTKLKDKGDPEAKEQLGAEPMMMQQCRVPVSEADGGGAWHVQRVGPFVSTGGYDWWQIGWSDAGGLKEVIDKHPEGVDIEASILIPVDEDGKRIGHPPVHIHHIHFVKPKSVRFRNIMRGFCVSSTGISTAPALDSLIKEQNCYNSSLYIEQHGDYQCVPEDDGIECLTSNYPSPRRLSEHLDLEGELNDVRPFDSPPMKWYYQIALKWRPIQAEKRALSQMTIMAPGRVDINDQLARVLTFPTPTDAPRFTYYVGSFWGSGELIRNKLHAHNLVFESSSFFLATKEQMGLDAKEYVLENSYTPKLISEIGYSSSDEMNRVMLENLAKSQSRFDEICTGDWAPDAMGVAASARRMLQSAVSADRALEEERQKVCTRPRPKWVCSAVYNSNEFEFGDPPQGFKFDRRPLTWCDPLIFRQGDSFVVTSTSRKLTQPPIPPFPDRIPDTIPGHVSWHFWYHHAGWFHSFFGRLVCNQEGSYFDAQTDLGFLDATSMLGAVFLSGGIPTDHSLRHALWWAVLVVLVATFVGFVLLFRPKKKSD